MSSHICYIFYLNYLFFTTFPLLCIPSIFSPHIMYMSEGTTPLSSYFLFLFSFYTRPAFALLAGGTDFPPQKAEMTCRCKQTSQIFTANQSLNNTRILCSLSGRKIRY